MNKGEKINRRDFLKVALLSAPVFLEACNSLTNEDLEALPSNNIQDIKQNPEKFLEYDTIKIQGFVEQTGQEGKHEEYSLPMYKYVWENIDAKYIRFTYVVSDQPDMGGNKMPAVSQEKLVDYDINDFGKALGISSPDPKQFFPEAIKGTKYEIVGRLLKVKAKENGKVEYVFEIGRLIKAPEKK